MGWGEDVGVCPPIIPGRERGDKKVERILDTVFKARVPVILWGPPGVGKTAIVGHIASRMRAELLCPHVRAPEDLALPVLEGGSVSIRPIAEFRRAVELGEQGRPAIIFVDELSTLPPAVQAAILRFLDSGRVGEYQIPHSVWRVAAGNPPEQAAGGWDLAAPTANRLLHLEFRLDPMKWAAEFPTYWGAAPVIPDIPSDIWARARALVSAFIRARPALLLQVPREESQRGRAWPSPRSWDMASRVLAAAELEGLPSDGVLELVSGAVGEGAALEFLNWLRALDLPDPEEILSGPERFQLPERGDKAFAVLAAVVAAAVSNLTPERWVAAWRVLARAADQGAPDVAAAAARGLAAARRPGFPRPVEEMKRFIPLLQEAGLLQAEG